ncbi:flippase-like domain-containing protein [Flavobacteriales bacterium]|nr:flippase-like domain-containing protein [Flavobacteriales bacterium]|tara:strand:- start:349 stop:1374 length:1026 start_codon:yes stop_codon:yes gene_type:complete
MNKKVLLKVLKYIASLGLAFGILYLLFNNQDPVRLVEEIQKVDGKWVVLSMIFGAWAYVSRGLRWIVLIDALGYKSSKIHSIAAVSVGYFTNMFIPRAGEISRCTALNQTDKIPVDKLFGTILVERVLDLIFLCFLILLIIALKFNDIFNFYNALQNQQTVTAGNSNLLSLFAIIAALVISLIFITTWVKKSSFYEKILDFIEGLKEGFKSFKKMKRKSAFWFHTFSIWIMYFLMTYICFFSMEETLHLTASDGLFLLVLGGIGMVIPTPGGVGSYHAIVMIGLSVLGVGTIYLGEGGDPTNPALLFPTIVHVAQTLVAIIMGASGLIILFVSKKKKNVSS